jgi:alpha-N-arabinofuranosidase
MPERTPLSKAAWIALGVVILGAPRAVAAEPSRIIVQTAREGPKIPTTQFGIFFEDINFGADGGVYAELVKNRSFEFPDPLMGWTKVARGGAEGTVRVLDRDPAIAANPHYVSLTVETVGDGLGVSNEGFRGIGVRAGETYRFSVRARGRETGLRVEVVAPDGTTLARADVAGIGPGWKTVTATLRPDATAAKARLVLLATGVGTLELDAVSLEPEATWKGRHPGLRADLVQLLAEMKPGFLRFPGGCIVEGKQLDTRYQWKNTLGPPDERRLLINRWNDEFKHRPAPDYFQSFGLGFYEFFLLCEDIGARPLPILNCGMACQFNSGELAPPDQIDRYVQDALDLIEFANGPASSPWGRRRAEMGHPAPFQLGMLGVGNEQWGPAYFERYERFARAIKERFPEIRLVASAGPSPADDRFRAAWKQFRSRGADIVDEHCYDRPTWFYDAATRYDTYDRKGPKVFMGEYAAQSVGVGKPENHSTWECALAEAAFMTGLERNADVVVLSSYAPLFAHIDAWQWTPDLIWFDNRRLFGTPSYHVQALFSRHRGEVVLPFKLSDSGRPAGGRPRLYVSATHDASRMDGPTDAGSGDVILKVVNAAAEPVETLVEVQGPGGIAANVTAFEIVSKLSDENTFEEPRKVAPVTRSLGAVAGHFTHTLAAHSLTVLRVRSVR